MFTQRDDYKSYFKNLQRLLIEGVRHYVVDDSTAYPSITSVISHVSRAKFADWRQRVGNEEANRVCKHATTRGTKLHTCFEHYMMNRDVESLEEYKVPLIQLMFKAAKPYLDDRFDNVFLQEARMCSHKLHLAGSVDLICEVDGELAIVDFKTAKAEKPEEWLEDYFVQLAAYWAMFSERTGVVPKKLVVFLVGENGDVQIVERRNIMDYMMILQDYVSKFIQHRDAKS